MDLPVVVLREVFAHLQSSELAGLRRVCWRWRFVVAPLVGECLKVDGFAKKGPILSKFLESHGWYTRTLRMKGDCWLFAESFWVYCPSITRLEIDIPTATREKTLYDIDLLTSHFRFLKHLALTGCYQTFPLQRYQNVLERLEVLSLEYVDSARIVDFRETKSSSLKKLILRGCGVDYYTFVEILFNFRSLDTLASYNQAIEFEYDLTRCLFSSFSMSTKTPAASANISFDTGNIPEISSKLRFRGEQEMARHSRMFDVVILAKDHCQLRLPTTEISIHAATIKFTLATKKQILNTLTSLTTIPCLDIKVMQKWRLQFPFSIYAAKQLSVSLAGGYNATFYKWLATCFPNLQELTIPQGSKFSFSLFSATHPKFPRLSHILCYDPHPASFWTAMAAAAPNLRQILLPPKSPLKPKLTRLLPTILIGQHKPNQKF
ncbi:hypothetical protein DSO57_1024362 [Entomophthora muscae]|uniref:Uncharacterized protein n=1 Tax=Entomophthora muscae TaxID=34485 RepID=A0ACC2RHE1_9FUNG|nr:hypothetical protein DSO57_1024362 [Entomophthora muscae]